MCVQVCTGEQTHAHRLTHTTRRVDDQIGAHLFQIELFHQAAQIRGQVDLPNDVVQACPDESPMELLLLPGTWKPVIQTIQGLDEEVQAIHSTPRRGQ